MVSILRLLCYINASITYDNGDYQYLINRENNRTKYHLNRDL